MLTPQSISRIGILASVWPLLNLGEGRLAAVHAQVEPPRPSPVMAAGRELFQQYCMKCHGADGTGKPGRKLMPNIPDFTDAGWQGRRNDTQLLSSILDGKGPDMRPFRDMIGMNQGRDLMAYVRAFAPSLAKTDHPEQEPLLPEASEFAPSSSGFFAKLIAWLGKFHPAAVHFPIGLLTAAAVAELLRLATAKLAFADAARYCVWFGSIAAVGAGALGWFLAGFRVSDASWIMTMHRWLGTFVVAWCGLVLVLCEASRRPDRRQARLWFRAALFIVAALVSVTGFFGGALVFGLDHYTWPS
jgi:uncharacterized membrane protein/mono/diheme cytochrome c family protein